MFIVPYLYKDDVSLDNESGPIFQGPPIITSDVEYAENLIQFSKNKGYKVSIVKEFDFDVDSVVSYDEVPKRDKTLVYRFIIEKFNEVSDVQNLFNQETEDNFNKIKNIKFHNNDGSLNDVLIKKYNKEINSVNEYFSKFPGSSHFQYDVYPNDNLKLISKFQNSIDVDEIDELERQFDLEQPVNKSNVYVYVTVFQQKINERPVYLGTMTQFGEFPKSVKWIGKNYITVGKMNSLVSYFNNSIELQHAELGCMTFVFHKVYKGKDIITCNMIDNINENFSQYFTADVPSIIKA